MRRPAAGLTRFTVRFAQDEDGGITVEAVVWIPVFFLVLMMITDASLAFFSRAQAYRILESGNRAFSLKDTSTTAATETWIETQFRSQFGRVGAANVDAVTTTDKAAGTVSTTLTYRARDVVPFNTLGVMTNWKISVQAQQFVEWSLS